MRGWGKVSTSAVTFVKANPVQTLIGNCYRFCNINCALLGVELKGIGLLFTTSESRTGAPHLHVPALTGVDHASCLWWQITKVLLKGGFSVFYFPVKTVLPITRFLIFQDLHIFFLFGHFFSQIKLIKLNGHVNICSVLGYRWNYGHVWKPPYCSRLQWCLRFPPGCGAAVQLWLMSDNETEPLLASASLPSRIPAFSMTLVAKNKRPGKTKQYKQHWGCEEKFLRVF